MYIFNLLLQIKKISALKVSILKYRMQNIFEKKLVTAHLQHKKQQKIATTSALAITINFQNTIAALLDPTDVMQSCLIFQQAHCQTSNTKLLTIVLKCNRT